jgi:hypothetical protein
MGRVWRPSAAIGPPSHRQPATFAITVMPKTAATAPATGHTPGISLASSASMATSTTAKPAPVMATRSQVVRVASDSTWRRRCRPARKNSRFW